MADAARARLPTAPGWARQPARDNRFIAWTAMAAGVLIALLGGLGDSTVLIALGAAMIAALGAFLAPQLVFAVFLVAGGLKAAPWLAGVPVDFTVLTAAGVMAAIVIRASKPDGIPPLPTATVLAVALTALIVLSVLWSPAPELGLDKALRFQILTMLAFFAPFILVRTRRDLTQLMVYLLIATLVVAATAVPGDAPNQPLTVAGGESEIELALYASTGLIAAAGYLVLIGRSRLRFLWFIPAVYLGGTVIDAGSRGVLVASVLAVLVVGIRSVARAEFKTGPIVAMVAAAILALVAVSNLTGPAADKYEKLFAETGTLGKRNFLVRDGVDLALQYPMGRGASGYQFETAFPYPHNMFVEVTAEQGIIGLTLLVALLVAAFRSSLRARGGPRSPESILAGGLMLVLVIDAMVSQTFTQFRELWFAMGLALALPLIRTPDEPPRRVARRT